MLDTITLDDASGAPVTLHAQTGKRMIHTATGLLGVSPVRQVVRSAPTRHGSIDESHWTDGSLIVLEGEVWSLVSIEDAFVEFHAIVKPMVETLDVGPALMKWREGATGPLLQKRVKLSSDVDPVLTGGHPSIAYQVQFRAEDPLAYSQTETTAVGGTLSTSGGGKIYPRVYPRTYAASAGGTVAVNNVGTRPTPAVFRIYGGCTNPQVLLAGGGVRIALVGTIATGNYMEIDVQHRTVKLNGLDSQYNFLDPVNTSWFALPVGTSTIQMIAGSFDLSARVDVVYRSAY